MLWSLSEETEGNLQMLLSLRENGLTSLFKEVRVFKEGPRRTKKTTRSKFTTRSIFTIALWFTIAAHLVRTPFSWELQTFSLSEKGSRRSKSGGVVKHYGVVIHYFCYRRSIFSTEGSFGSLFF